jgi:hypothetical protein
MGDIIERARKLIEETTKGCGRINEVWVVERTQRGIEIVVGEGRIGDQDVYYVIWSKEEVQGFVVVPQGGDVKSRGLKAYIEGDQFGEFVVIEIEWWDDSHQICWWESLMIPTESLVTWTKDSHKYRFGRITFIEGSDS